MRFALPVCAAIILGCTGLGRKDEGSLPGACGDLADNDADGVFDCDDSSCATSPQCVESDPDTDIDTDIDTDTDTDPLFHPDEYRIVGRAFYQRTIAASFPPNPGGYLSIGFLREAEAEPDIVGMFWFELPTDGCGPFIESELPLLHTYGDAITIAGPNGDLTLTPDDDDAYGVAIEPRDVAVDKPYDLLPVETIDGTDAIPNMFRIPGWLDWSGGAIGGSTRSSLTARDLKWTFDPGNWEYVGVWAKLHGDSRLLAETFCVVPATDGEIAIPVATWKSADLAIGESWEVHLGAVAIQDANIEGGRGKSRLVVDRWESGYAYVDR